MSAHEMLSVIGLIVGAGTAVNGFLFKQIFNKVGRMEEKLNSALQELPEKYKLKSDCHDCEKRIINRLAGTEKRISAVERNTTLLKAKDAKA